ncbi:protein phosphatase 2C domain-containing protein [Devosia sp.]|uniref:protein phosphatase 2C domain-containing protein n=1 Tax=Devosia sp. TaxID=1871048 RepID=UPI00273690D2|nr:protein phosphatase 2C domain-containing protein [Devosia sp.]MDP2778896.1 protein phosphatase 2C domain-containing protein [Devosia sp.]
MAFEVRWNSRTGTGTPDNRDFGGVGLRGAAAIAMIADGATTRPQSGALAERLVRTIIERFMTESGSVTPEILRGWLSACHQPLTHVFSAASASYLILYKETNGTAFTMHAGDCLIGSVRGANAITWLVQPHTLANAITTSMDIADIAASELRHRLTRSFRHREFMPPTETILPPLDGPLVLATDGFWADADHDDQLRMMTGQASDAHGDRDDSSILQIWPSQEDPAPEFIVDAGQNFLLCR